MITKKVHYPLDKSELSALGTTTKENFQEIVPGHQKNPDGPYLFCTAYK